MSMSNLLGGVLQGLSQSYLTQKQRTADKASAEEKRQIDVLGKLATSGDPETAGWAQEQIRAIVEKGMPKAQRGIFQQLTAGMAPQQPQPRHSMEMRTEERLSPMGGPMSSAPLPPTKAGGPQPNPNMQAPAPPPQPSFAQAGTLGSMPSFARPEPPPAPEGVAPAVPSAPDANAQAMTMIDQIVSQYTNPTAQRIVRKRLLDQMAQQQMQQLFSTAATTPPRPAGVVQVVVQDDTSPTKWSSVSIIEEPTGTREIGRVKGVAPPASATPRADNQTFEEATYADWLKAVPKGYTADHVGYAKWKSDKSADAKGDQIYSVYPVQVGTNPDGSPIIQYLSPTAAQGKSPAKTIYGPGGEAITGTAKGYSTSPPPGVPSDVQTSLAGWTQAIGTIDRIIPQLKQLKDTLGPAAGRIQLAQTNNLGGMGLSNEQIRLAIDLRRLLMSQAFAEGGKQLTPTEKEEFKALNPALSDTFEQALIKAQQSRDYLDRRYKMRVEFLGPRQQGQVPAAPPLGITPPPTPDAGTGSPKVGDVKTFPNGRRGRWDGSGWEAVQ